MSSNEKYAYRTQRVGGRVKRKYLGKRSDPLVDLLYCRDRLDKANRRAHHHDRREEIRQAKTGEALLKRLARTTEHWLLLDECLARMPNGNYPTYSLAGPATDPQGILYLECVVTLPDKTYFRELCNNADKGDVRSMKELDQILKKMPDVVAAMTDVVTVAREEVIRGLAGNSNSTQQAVRQAIKNTTEKLADNCDDDPLGSMYATVATIAWQDALRCCLASARWADEHTESKFWAIQSDRASRRFQRVAKEFRDHQKRWRKIVANKNPTPTKDKENE